jgi:glutathione synthase/RimK-type ligase-like ATP-grasp enzyme
MTALVLILSNADDTTADSVQDGLTKRGARALRLNLEAYPAAAGLTTSFAARTAARHAIRVNGVETALDDIRAVYFRRPGRLTVDEDVMDVAARRFAQEESKWAANGLWLTLACPWVNHPIRVHVAEHKLVQLAAARELGFDVPRTMVTNDPAHARAFHEELHGDIVAKPVRQPTIKKDGRLGFIYTHHLNGSERELLDDVRFAPCILQERIDKRVEIRATVVGDRVLAAQIDSQASPVSREDWRRYDLANTPYSVHALPDDVSARCVGLTRRLGLDFGALDLIVTPEGRYVFLEINPNGQWGWVEELTGLRIRDAICDLLLSGGNADGSSARSATGTPGAQLCRDAHWGV